MHTYEMYHLRKSATIEKLDKEKIKKITQLRFS